MKTILVTGSGGLIGSEAVRFFAEKGFRVIGIDNDMRSYFFGADGSVRKNIEHLTSTIAQYRHYEVDIRSYPDVEQFFSTHKFDGVIHTAAQPSHDWAVREPLTDFTVNALGTHHLLEATRCYAPDAVFIFLSTNKVYGDLPNTLPIIEQETRYELPETHPYYQGIDETLSIDQSKHSLFGVSKASADLLVQEYGRYFGMKTCCFRGGCLTGSQHAGVELHGFLSYLVKCIVHERRYTIYGYQGKQVRDNIHAFDVVSACYAFLNNPRSGAVYNIGGSRFSNISMIEAVTIIEKISGKKARTQYVNTPRAGDHCWYISDVRKFQHDYPSWQYTKSINTMLEEMCRAEMGLLS